MFDIIVSWDEEEGAYIVRQNDEFIGDFPTLHPALEFALGVRDNDQTSFAGLRVIVEAIQS